MTCLSKLVACTIIMALMVSSMVMVNSAKVNAADGGSESATGKITIWCYDMPYYSIAVCDETGEGLDNFYIWGYAPGINEANFSKVIAHNDGKYYSVDRLYTIEVKEAYTKLVYTTYAHGGDEITISHTNGWTTYLGKVPPQNTSSEQSATNVPSSEPTYLNPTPRSSTYSNPPANTAQSENSFINEASDFFEGFGWEKATLSVTTVLIVVLALGMIVLWRRTSKLMKTNHQLG